MVELSWRNAMLRHVERSNHVAHPIRVMLDFDGNEIAAFDDGAGHRRYVRLMTWLPGRLWSQVLPQTDRLRRELGEQAGRMTLALQGFDCPESHRYHRWDLASSSWTVEHLERFDTEQQEKIKYFQQLFAGLSDHYLQLRKSVIHGDINDNNIVVDTKLNHPSLVGIIDFGDAVYSQTINELAITIAYAIIDQPDPVSAAIAVVSGFHSACPLQEQELECLYALVGMRFVVSLTHAAINRDREPENEYLLISEAPAWTALNLWREVQPEFAYFRFREACEFEPHPNSVRFKDWAAGNQVSVNTLFPSLNGHSIQFVDMSVSGNWLGHEQEFENLELTEFKLSQLKQQEPDSIVAGGYLETRPFYSTDAFAKEGNNGPEYRTVHLGTDFWVAAGTPIHAIADGVVLSVFNNDHHKDYGPTIILRHELDNGDHFFTLYGHLSKTSLELFAPGDYLSKGQLLAYVGASNENGNWAPHLHFQIMLDLLGNSHDFPGVAFPNEIATWKSLCPDPGEWFQQLATMKSSSMSTNKMIEFRRDYLGKGMSVAYQKPLHVVRGSGVWLIDQSGRKFLDTVNNVAHVGHEHPRIVEAAQRQMALLNTNTRYLHTAINEFAEVLLETFPAELSVVHFVNSGSEANELALRMAKTYRGHSDFIAVEMGYHGNTNACVDVSSYKFDGKGGLGAPPSTYVVPLPDQFRGIYRGDETSQTYANHIQEQIAAITTSGRSLAGFICESIISCGGQIELPEGYLASAYKMVRAAGGVCIADEVQTGCGRVGSHFWAFQLHDVVPDIVTIGKPIGNGHPLAAVVCTRDVADAFANGMEYFNTFGGNPVSCKIGREVLQVVQDEGLQQNAKNVGSYLKNELRNLSQEFPLIQDVRGQGLFLGFELVDANHCPLPEQASYLVNRMRELGVLMSTDGKDHNAIKIKPPMVFSQHHCDELLNRLREVLREDLLQHHAR